MADLPPPAASSPATSSFNGGCGFQPRLAVHGGCGFQPRQANTPPFVRPLLSRPPRLALSLAVSLLLLVPSVPASSPARTADNRLTVSGASSVLNRQLADSLSTFVTALETRIAAPVPFPDFPLLVILSPPAATATRPECLRMQAWDAGDLHQRLLAPAPDYLDAEDLETSLAALLLARCAAPLVPPARRCGNGPEAPEWIPAGLAQLLRPEALARDRRQIAADLSASAPLALADVLRLHQMPSGPWREKAYAAAAVDFLFPAASTATWMALFRALAAADPVDLAHFQAFHPPLDAPDPEALWLDHLRRWSASPDPEADPGDARDFAVEAALRRALTVTPRDWASTVPPDFPETLYAPDLIEYRALPVARDLASALATHMQSFLLNASPSFRPVIAAYADYFLAFLSPPPPARASRRNREAALAAADATFRLNLVRQWQRAEALHQQNLLNRQARRDWIDAVEARLAPPPAALPPPRPDTPLHRYLDALEAR